MVSFKRIKAFGVFMAVSAAGMSALSSVSAAVFTYSNTATATENWSAGTNWSPSAPVSGSDTSLVFGPGVLADGTAIVSNNDLGTFTLNQLTTTYTGPNAAPTTAATVTIQGNDLQFTNDGATTPAITVTSNRGGSSGTNSKPKLTLANNIILDSSVLTMTGTSNASGGPVALDMTGGLTYTTAVAHTLAFSGNLATNGFAANIVDQSAGNATSVTKSGTSVWVLTGTNGYTGGTTIGGGVLQSTVSEGFGTGLVTVNSGQALATGATYSNDWELGGGSIRLGATTISGLITLTANSQIVYPTTNVNPVISGKITGNGGLTFVGQAGVTSTMTLSNPGNDYTGDTALTISTTSGRDSILSLTSSEVIPNGVGKGNLFFSATSEQGSMIVQLNGNTETINGLSSNVPGGVGGLTGVQRIQNAAATPGTLIVGDNNASGTFVGGLQNGSGAGALNVTKIGAGTQVFSGAATHTGTTTISGGALKIDYTLYGTSLTSDAANYYSAASDMVLAGGTTFAIQGRGDGGSIQQTGVNIANAGRSISLPNALAAQLVVGQELLLTKTAGSGNLTSGAAFISAIDAPGATNTTVWANKRMASGSSLTATVDTNATDGTTSQTLKSLTLSGLSGEIATLDFGTSGDVMLKVNAAPVQVNDGSILTIANWNGVAGQGGGTNQLVFTGLPTDFSSVFSQDEINFAGYGSGYELIDNGGTYEVVATAAGVPEPMSLAIMGLGAAALLARRRERCSR